MEWNFECPNGGITVRQEGERAVCLAVSRPETEGLYKAWLRGEGGEVLLGTLIPEGGVLRLRRSISVSGLKERGAWPPTGAWIVMTCPFPSEETAAPGWRRTDRPDRLTEDRLLSQCLRGVDRALLKREGEGFFLALPFVPGCPFPLTPLFCLSRVERMGGGLWAVFRFSGRGKPVPLYGASGEGEGEACPADRQV